MEKYFSKLNWLLILIFDILSIGNLLALSNRNNFMNNLKSVKLFELENLKIDKDSKEYAREIINLKGVNEMILFPDTHTKTKYVNANYKITIPSSAVISSDLEYLYPQFRSRGINCGMTVVALPFSEEDLKEKFVLKLFNSILYSIPYYINYRLRLATPFLSSKYDLSHKEFKGVLEGGAKAYAGFRNSNNNQLENFDFQGCFKNLKEINYAQYINKAWMDYRNIRLRNSFGRYYGGNHFFEIQVVNKVIDNEKTNLKEGQIVIVFHTAGESLEDIIREDWRDKYIRSKNYKYIKKEDPAYQGFFFSQALAMNYGFAYRYATVLMIDDLLKKYFGGDKNVDVILDKSHNFVTEEEIRGKQQIIYRHNAEKILPGGLALLSGFYNTFSYIVKGGEDLENSLYSMDHGYGKVIKDTMPGHELENFVQIQRNKKGLKSSFFKKIRKEKIVFYKEVDEYFAVMKKNNLLTSSIELRPIINMKFN